MRRPSCFPLSIPPSRLRRATVPQFSMVVPLRSQARLWYSLLHWAYYGLFPPQAAAFVRPFSLREKGGFWAEQLPAIVPLTKRLPFRKRGAGGVSRLRGCLLPLSRSRLSSARSPQRRNTAQALAQRGAQAGVRAKQARAVRRRETAGRFCSGCGDTSSPG